METLALGVNCSIILAHGLGATQAPDLWVEEGGGQAVGMGTGAASVSPAESAIRMEARAVVVLRCMSVGYPVLCVDTVSYTHLRAHETPEHLVCRLLLEKKKKKKIKQKNIHTQKKNQIQK
eukprot:TRINITY_DN15567_c0_g1_i2.p3 TRINITY_DN15567_c0_g1~~TRINITY_DN15567_c0_g1_i2.p3  ORF type:complete len:121 (-),score=33.54 TRINITY_DN15567_c0_g1_i2:50-412(-)